MSDGEIDLLISNKYSFKNRGYYKYIWTVGDVIDYKIILLYG